jgi:hypothetical protein
MVQKRKIRRRNAMTHYGILVTIAVLLGLNVVTLWGIVPLLLDVRWYLMRMKGDRYDGQQ